MAPARPLVRAPEFPAVAWLNGTSPVSLEALRGRVLLVDVFDFTSLPCLRALPCLRDWNRRYDQAGLIILGVHTPAFNFGEDDAVLRRALGRLGIRWPVALDNNRDIWTSLGALVRPTCLLIDRAGCVRLRLEGSGRYEDLESTLRMLLREGVPASYELPPPLLPGDGEVEGTFDLSTLELPVGSVGNGPLSVDHTAILAVPEGRPEGAFYLGGEWRLARQGLTLESRDGEIALPFRGAGVHAVASARPDDPLGAGGEPAWLEATLDGDHVGPGQFGQDLLARQGGSWLRVDAARAYNLLQAVGPGLHDLRLRCVSPGTTLYALACDALPEPDSPATRSAPC